MKKLLIVVTALVVAVTGLTVYTGTYNTNPDKVVAVNSETANAEETVEDTIEVDIVSSKKPAEEADDDDVCQYRIIAENNLYGQDDYSDYVPAKTEYVDGFPEVDGRKTYNAYYKTSGYETPAEEEKPREDWNLYDFHKNGELIESVGNGTMSFRTKEDRDAYLSSLEDEYGKENVNASNYDADGKSNTVADKTQNVVDEVNEKQQDTLEAAEQSEQTGQSEESKD